VARQKVDVHVGHCLSREGPVFLQQQVFPSAVKPLDDRLRPLHQRAHFGNFFGRKLVVHGDVPVRDDEQMPLSCRLIGYQDRSMLTAIDGLSVKDFFIAESA